ncbi:MAG: four helix bundle protein [Crocinitomicaceae bacterium]|nr:four helix bundle protein [Crocinitomicaceae bacterium]
MTITKFEDLVAWQKGQDLSVEVYKVFRNSKDFSFKDQICRASVSISNNIAEGFDRFNPKEFRRFLFIAIASCAEVKSMLYLALRLEYISKDLNEKLILICTEISKIIRGLINSIKIK